MEDQIINRIKESNLITLDLEELYPDNPRAEFDLSKWLDNGTVLREKVFRAYAKSHDWSKYNNHFVAIVCKTEAILPAWASLLISTYVSQFAQKVILGSLENLEEFIINDVVYNIDLTKFIDKSVIIKGCTEKKIPENTFVLLTQKLQPVVKSLFYGEACSSVPLFKKKYN
tara:strand:+ start:1183 stop:1695 length:513 start_codon:yes stop_codon:yes gene_type:complete